MKSNAALYNYYAFFKKFAATISKKHFKKSINQPEIWLSAGLILFFITLIFIPVDRFYDAEISILQFFYNWPLALKPLFLVITQLGSGWMIGCALALTLVYRKFKALKYLAVSSTGAYLLTVALKLIIDRPRPTHVLPRIIERQSTLTNHGFPSGHTAVTAAIALSLLPFIPKRWRWLVPLWILAVAISRLYLGVHAPLDLIGGLAVGLSVAGFVGVLQSKDKANA